MTSSLFPMFHALRVKKIASKPLPTPTEYFVSE
jgi:hypothetical protein